MDNPSVKALNSDLRDRYYNRFQDTWVKAWSNTNINKLMKVLSKHGEIILSDALMNNLNNPDNGKLIYITMNCSKIIE